MTKLTRNVTCFRSRYTICCVIALLLCMCASAQSRIPASLREYAAGYQSDANNIRPIVRGLTAPYRTEADKAAAIYVWIKQNIKFDFTRYAYYMEDSSNVDAYTPNETLEHKLGMSADIAALTDTMLKVAGIKTQIVRGCARQVYATSAEEGEIRRHSWNAVKVNGQWKLMDCTWAILNQGAANIVTFDLVDYAFLAEPDQFIFTP